VISNLTWLDLTILEALLYTWRDYTIHDTVNISDVYQCIIIFDDFTKGRFFFDACQNAIFISLSTMLIEFQLGSAIIF
jgi:hypothetical protein